jgi:hypothetical protein
VRVYILFLFLNCDPFFVWSSSLYRLESATFLIVIGLSLLDQIVSLDESPPSISLQLTTKMQLCLFLITSDKLVSFLLWFDCAATSIDFNSAHVLVDEWAPHC